MIAKTNQFFERVRAIYGKAKYDSQFADAEDLSRAKRTWSKQIATLTSSQFKIGFDQLKKNILRGDGDWEWPSIGKIIGLCRKSERIHPSHKLFLPQKEYEKTERLEEIGNSAIAEMRKGLGGSGNAS